MSSLAQSYYTPEEYLALERKAEYKSEYIDGQIRPMCCRNHEGALVSVNREHVLISVNLVGELWTQSRGRPCEVYNGDMRVKVSPTGMYTYPDVTVVLGEPLFDDLQRDTLTNPNVIIEVLSPSTEVYDRGAKFAHYRNLPSLTDYILVSQDKAQVEHYARQSKAGDKWELTAISDPHGVLQLASIDCTLALRDIYERVEFPVEENPAANPNP